MASRYPSGNYGNGGGGGSKENGNANKDNGNAKDNVFDLDSAVFASDQFRMHEFKVKRCPRARPHDWTQCPFAHPGEKARRRDPRRYKYSGTACPEFRKSGCCRRGDACPFAHGVFECWLHPSRYRTQLCTDGTNCKRRVCFFAHVETELRHPEDDPGVAQKQVQAELAAEVQTLQQQHFTQALQALLLQTTNPVTSPERQPSQLPALTLEMLKQNPQVTPTEMMTDPATDSNNSTAALQLVLLQQLAAKEQQIQQNMGDKASDVPTSDVDTSLVAVTQGNNNGVQHQPDVYDALSQLKQLSLSATAPVSSTSPAVGPSFDASALLSQMLPNGGTTTGGADLNSHPLLINSLLNQNAMKMGTDANGGQPRRSIDNSYLSTLITDGSLHAFGSSMGFPAVALQNGGYMAGGTNGITQDASNAAVTAAAAAVAAAPVQNPTASNGMYPAVSNGAPAMYSMENIQRLLQNPAFSSNLSQLFQMNPALLQQLTSNPAESGNPIRHSIDNAYLTRLNTDMNRLVDNGGVKGMTTGEQTTPARPEPLMNGYSAAPQNHDSEKLLNGAIVSESLLQELNALKLQLGSSLTIPTTMSGNNQLESNGYPSFPPHSSPDSDGPTTSCGQPTNPEQGHTEDSN